MIEIAFSFAVGDTVVFGLGRALGDALRGDDEPLNLYVQSLAGALVEHLLTHYVADKTTVRVANGGLAPPKLRRAVEFIDAHLAQNMTMYELWKMRSGLAVECHSIVWDTAKMLEILGARS